MAKRAFQGQNDAPAPPQGFNLSVHDEPKAKNVSPKKTPTFSGYGPTGDPRDMHSKLPQSIEHDGTSTESKMQKREPGNEGRISGLPKPGFSKRV